MAPNPNLKPTTEFLTSEEWNARYGDMRNEPAIFDLPDEREALKTPARDVDWGCVDGRLVPVEVKK